jgi:SPP1 gp7 family putative phage head morphogenesis protein
MIYKSLARLALRKQILLEGIKSYGVRNFLRTLDKLDNLVVDMLLAQRVPDMSDLSKGRLQALIGDLTNATGELFSKATGDFLDTLPALAAYEVEHEVKSLSSIASDATKAKLATPAQSAWEDAQARPVQASGTLLSNLVENWQEASVQRVNDTIRLGHAHGVTVPEMVRRLVGTSSLQYKDGTNITSKRNAATVVRTAVQHVANSARALTWEQNSDLVLGYMFLATLDKRTSPVCRSLDQQHFQLGKGPMPPVHANCRSTTTPDLGPEFDYLRAGATRSSEEGYVDENLQYYDFLKEQDATYQNAVLGPTRAMLFRDGGLTSERFRELQLDKNYMPITLEEMRALEPKAFQRAGL